jgi:hypothetical protein
MVAVKSRLRILRGRRIRLIDIVKISLIRELERRTLRRETVSQEMIEEIG